MARKYCEAINNGRLCGLRGRWFLRVRYSSRPMVACESCAKTHGAPNWRATAQRI